MERLTGRFKDGGAFILPSVVSQLSPMKSEIIEKLADYEDAEEQGLLLRLPCKVGDKAYVIANKTRLYEMEILSIYPFGALYEDEEKEISRVYNLFLDGNVYYKHCTFYDFGKTVFLTREEAEKALAEMGV